MIKISKLAKAVRLATVFSVATTALGASNIALAQDSSATEVEKITVTGLRIERTDLESASPVISNTAADINLKVT
ncbi:MAG: iron complex outermembrane receptor protein [Congregibacter sp.]|jgi:iron complex outermembrane receptor protein